MPFTPNQEDCSRQLTLQLLTVSADRMPQQVSGSNSSKLQDRLEESTQKLWRLCHLAALWSSWQPRRGRYSSRYDVLQCAQVKQWHRHRLAGISVASAGLWS